MQHTLVTRGDLSVVKFGMKLRTADVKAFLAKHELRQMNANGIFSFRVNNTDWNEFRPMVALGSNLQRSGKEFFVSVPPLGGDPDRILLISRGKTEFWEECTWFICRHLLRATTL